MITIDQYNKAEGKLKEIKDKHDKISKKQSQESNKLQNKYWDLERELNQKKFKEQEKLREKHEKEQENMKKQIVPHARITSNFKRIIDMIDINKNQHATDFTVYKFDYPRDGKGEIIRVQRGHCLGYPDKIEMPYSPIDTIKDDKYAKIQAFIVENDKPKNKFSLIIAGNTIFTKKIIELPYGYGCSCHTNDANIRHSIKDLSTEKELQEYYQRNKSKLLKKDSFEQLPKIEKEYENTLKNTNSKKWELAYWESRKRYYEECYSHGTETEEYREVLKQIKKINVGN